MMVSTVWTHRLCFGASLMCSLSRTGTLSHGTAASCHRRTPTVLPANWPQAHHSVLPGRSILRSAGSSAPQQVRRGRPNHPEHDHSLGMNNANRTRMAHPGPAWHAAVKPTSAVLSQTKHLPSSKQVSELHWL